MLPWWQSHGNCFLEEKIFFLKKIMAAVWRPSGDIHNFILKKIAIAMPLASTWQPSERHRHDVPIGKIN